MKPVNDPVIPCLPSDYRHGVILGTETAHGDDPMAVALFTIRIAHYLGVLPTFSGDSLPYSLSNDTLLFDAPLTSLVTGARTRFLRGWKQYQSCIKGFNALGLMAEHTLSEYRRLTELPASELRVEKRRFVETRAVDGDGGGRRVFTGDEGAQIPDAELDRIDVFPIAIWRAFGDRTIVCSTSSNMGISLHEALRYMQQKELTVLGQRCRLLNSDEGGLIIWCPDEQADFMNREKTALLRGIEAELPRLTKLRTYINRKQRDPGALRDALECGGYFFPTNPQSKSEMHNLLTLSLHELAKDRNTSFTFLLRDGKIRQALESLGARVHTDHIIVENGVEGGLCGLMVPYLLLIEETLSRGNSDSISTWNQASIGAALAAAVLCDELLSSPEKIPSTNLEELKALLPQVHQTVIARRFHRSLRTRIHGVFDIANLQSLAQLFGVVINDHLSGRGTAFVGLGSSSYSNGNRCYDILRDSSEKRGAFRGKIALHPATHTLNPVSQALIFAEDLFRAVRWNRFSTLSPTAQSEFVRLHSRKPEPAGAAALAGYLLKRLDTNTLAVTEVAYVLRLGGFRRESFLKFCGYTEETSEFSAFVQEASEEGPRMEEFARDLLKNLDLPITDLARRAESDRRRSRVEYLWNPIHEDGFEAGNPILTIYLTGDNCDQPDAHLVSELLHEVQTRLKSTTETLDLDLLHREQLRRVLSVKLVKGVHSALCSVASFLQEGADTLVRHHLKPRISASLVQGARLVSRSVQMSNTTTPHFSSLILESFSRNADRAFLIEHATSREFTYNEFFMLAQRAAGLLRDHGIGHGDRVIVSMPNSVECAALYFGAIFIGAVTVPLNPTLSRAEADFILGSARARLVLLSATTAHIVRESRVADLPRSIRISLELEGASDGIDIREAKAASPFSDATDEDILSILYTSGTTGTPKGVVNRVAASVLNAEMFNEAMGIGEQHRFLHNWPMSYSTGLLNCLLMPFCAGASVVLHRPFDAAGILNFWEPVRRHGVTALWLSPTMAAALVKLDRDEAGIAYCREKIATICVGTAPLPKVVQENFEKKYQKPLYESFGLSELLILTSNTPQRVTPGVGAPLSGVEVRCADERGAFLPVGEEGEVFIRTPCIMAGYLNYQTGEPDVRTPEEWFPTGDIGVLDPDGALVITGRKKDLIIRGGLNISPRQIEEVLYSHPAVQTCAVVGLPDDLYGEQIVAAVECRPGYFFEDVKGSLYEQCKGELAASSVPQIILETADFPVNRNGKLMKNVLRDQLRERLSAKPVRTEQQHSQVYTP
jgi:acyl-CoA synthetase (AMP-forming)/AMP-acid ligase II